MRTSSIVNNIIFKLEKEIPSWLLLFNERVDFNQLLITDRFSRSNADILSTKYRLDIVDNHWETDGDQSAISRKTVTYPWSEYRFQCSKMNPQPSKILRRPTTTVWRLTKTSLRPQTTNTRQMVVGCRQLVVSLVRLRLKSPPSHHVNVLYIWRHLLLFLIAIIINVLHCTTNQSGKARQGRYMTQERSSPMPPGNLASWWCACKVWSDRPQLHSALALYFHSWRLWLVMACSARILW